MGTNTNTNNSNSDSGNNVGDSASLSQDYINRLKEELLAAELCYAEACAKADKASDEYTHAKAWKDLLEAYFNRVGKTLDLAAEVLLLLESTKGQSEIICQNIKCTVQATQILILEVKATSESVEGLKGKIKALIDLIDCLNDPALDYSASILKCVMALKVAVDEALTASLDAIKAGLGLLKAINMLLCKICDTNLPGAEGGEGSDIQDSLIRNLEKLIDLIRCGEALTEGRLQGESGKDKAVKAKPSKKARVRAIAPGPAQGDDDCGEEVAEPSCNIGLKPCLCFDRESTDKEDQSGFSTNRYYYQTRSKHKHAVELVTYKKCLLDKAEKAKSKAQSLRDAIKGALDAAEAAKAC